MRCGGARRVSGPLFLWSHHDDPCAYTLTLCVCGLLSLSQVDYTLGRELPHVLTRPQPTADSDVSPGVTIFATMEACQ